MKSFKAMMAEVAEPNSEEEKAFKAQHKVAINKHPVATEFQHKGFAKPKAKRRADQEGSANYDLAYESVDLEEMKVKNSDAAFKLETEISNLEKRITKLKPAALKDDDANMKLAIAKKSLKQKQDSHSALMKEGADEEPASPDEASMAMKQADFLAYVGREMKDHIKAGKEFPEWMQNKLSKLQQAAQDLHSNFGAHGEDDMKEELSTKQKKIDLNKNGKVDGNDLAMLRARKNEAKIPKGYHKMPDGTIMKDSDHKDGVDKAVDRLTKEGYASAAQRKAVWASRNEKGVKEELKGNQHKLDKNKNGKIDAQDFKLLKKEAADITELSKKTLKSYKKAATSQVMTAFNRDPSDYYTQKMADKMDRRAGNIGTAAEKLDKIKKMKNKLKKEAADKPVSPFDYKNYKSQIPTKPGEKAGFDSKKVSTGTVYSRKPVKEELDVELDEAFKTGLVKLKDGSSMVLKKEDADVLNKMLSKMSGGSVSKMTETAMKDKNGFAEILAFAKEAA